MADRRIYFACPERIDAIGGVRMIYRQVDILNRHGIAAFVLHRNPGFRTAWFENQTPIAYVPNVAFTLDDIIVFPESFGPLIFQIAPGVPRVIFNQNCFNTFLGCEPKKLADKTPYLMPEFRGVIVVSEDSRQYLHHVFPAAPVFRLHYSINPDLYYFQEKKKPQIAYMPRKNAEDAIQVTNILKFRDALGDFQIQAIDGVSETEAAAILRESLVFLSFGHPEGFGLPPAEAMACGCLTAGYHGMGGREFFLPEFSFPIDAGDVLAFARTVESLLTQYRADPRPLDEERQQAARFIASRYPPQQEEQDILTIWNTLLERS